MSAGSELDLGTVVVEVGATLRGVVHDTAGRPIAGAQVAARRSLDDVLREEQGFRVVAGHRIPKGPALRGAVRLRPVHATTAEDGSFELVGVPARDGLRVTVTHSGFATAVMEPVSVAVTPRVAVTMAARMALGGRVTDARIGAAVTRFGARARRVAAGDAGAPGSLPAIESHPDGTFRLWVEDPGRYVIDVAAPGHIPTTIGPVEVGAGGLAEDLVVRLESGVAITGAVRDHSTGKPVPGAKIVLCPARASEGRAAEPDFRSLFADAAELPAEAPLAVVRSGKAGGFSFPPMRPGRYRVVVTSPTHARTARDLVAASGGDPLTIEVPARGGLIGTLAGPVRGEPSVEIRRLGAPPVTVPVARDGSYRARGLEPGEYWVRVADAEPTPLARLSALRGGPDVVVRSGATARFDLGGRRFSAVSGQLLVNGTPRPGARVELLPVDPAAPAASAAAIPRATTDAGGRFVVDGVAPGRYRLQLRSGGSVLRDEEIFVTRGRAWTRRLEVAAGTLEIGLPGGHGEGSVALVRRAEAPAAAPSTWQRFGSFRRAVVRQGRAVLDDLPAGEWRYEITGPTGDEQVGTVRVVARSRARVVVDAGPARPAARRR